MGLNRWARDQNATGHGLGAEGAVSSVNTVDRNTRASEVRPLSQPLRLVFDYSEHVTLYAISAPSAPFGPVARFAKDFGGSYEERGLPAPAVRISQSHYPH